MRKGWGKERRGEGLENEEGMGEGERRRWVRDMKKRWICEVREEGEGSERKCRGRRGQVRREGLKGTTGEMQRDKGEGKDRGNKGRWSKRMRRNWKTSHSHMKLVNTTN